MNQTTFTLEWPPTYKIKKHRRAKYVKLRASLSHGLEITIPTRFNTKEIPFILEENKKWISNELLKIHSQLNSHLPEEIHLNALNEIWKVHYLLCDKKLEMINRPHQELVLVGDINDKTLCKKKLVAWIKERAKIHLFELLEEVSKQSQLYYSDVILRDQQTRWGSCSSDKLISLNYRLIFLPVYLVTHILIHELCHTKYLNHSTRFWQLVEKHDPNWKTHRIELRNAEKFVPSWIHY